MNRRESSKKQKRVSHLRKKISGSVLSGQGPSFSF